MAGAVVAAPALQPLGCSHTPWQPADAPGKPTLGAPGVARAHVVVVLAQAKDAQQAPRAGALVRALLRQRAVQHAPGLASLLTTPPLLPGRGGARRARGLGLRLGLRRAAGLLSARAAPLLAAPPATLSLWLRRDTARRGATAHNPPGGIALPAALHPRLRVQAKQVLARAAPLSYGSKQPTPQPSPSAASCLHEATAHHNSPPKGTCEGRSGARGGAGRRAGRGGNCPRAR